MTKPLLTTERDEARAIELAKSILELEGSVSGFEYQLRLRPMAIELAKLVSDMGRKWGGK